MSKERREFLDKLHALFAEYEVEIWTKESEGLGLGYHPEYVHFRFPNDESIIVEERSSMDSDTILAAIKIIDSTIES